MLRISLTSGDWRKFGTVDRAIQRRYDTYKLQRMFGLDHPDKVNALPAHYADWALQFDAVEQGAADQREADRQAQLWGGE